MDLSRDTLLQTLGEASSQVHGEAQKSAESMLKSWEKIPGFFFWLQVRNFFKDNKHDFTTYFRTLTRVILVSGYIFR